MKTRILTAQFPDGTIVKRRTARTYSHVVGHKNKIPLGSISWVGRPDLIKARLKDFSDPVVGEVIDDPWEKN